jgi:hypothetical protein
MLKFTTLEGKVVLNPSVLLMAEFTDILAYGKKKKNEDLGNRMLIYIFYCCDLTEQNPLRDIDYRLKEENAFSRAFKKIKKKKFTVEEEKLIDAAIDCYNFHNETALERATLTYDRKMDEIRTLLESTEPEIHPVMDLDTGQVDKYVSNNKILADFSKQLNDMAIYKLKAMETAKKIENTGRVRGDKGSSLIERGVFRTDGK